MKKKTVVIIVVTICVLFLFLCLAVVGGIFAVRHFAKKAIETSTGVKVDTDNKGGKITFTDKEGKGSMTFEGGKTQSWPAEMFPEVPEIKVGKIKAVSKIEVEGKKHFSIALEEIDTKTMESYKKELEGAGWKITMTMTQNDGEMFMASKNNLILTMVSMDKKKEASLSISQKE